jgi:IclR family pca regulon transcriptional regulator
VSPRQADPTGVAEMAELAGLGRPTVHRYTGALVRITCLEQGRARDRWSAPAAADPGVESVREVRRSLPVRVVLEDLRERVGYTVSMGLLDGPRVLYVHRLFGDRHARPTIDSELRVGAHVPAYCTALGKAMLASLPARERRELVATIDLVPHGPRSIVSREELLAELDGAEPRAPIVSDEEFSLGTRSIAMLLQRPGGEAPMAIEVSVPSDAYTAAQLREQVGPELRRAVRLSGG